MEYEAPAVTGVTQVGEPLIGNITSVAVNPRWNEDQNDS
jgi:hypothetical protein